MTPPRPKHTITDVLIPSLRGEGRRAALDKLWLLFHQDMRRVALKKFRGRSLSGALASVQSAIPAIYRRLDKDDSFYAQLTDREAVRLKFCDESRNQARLLIRRRKRRRSRQVDRDVYRIADRGAERSPEKLLEAEEIRQRLEASLPPYVYQAGILELEGWTHDRIAEHLERSPRTIRTYLRLFNQAMARFRDGQQE
ncbi:ECF-type sigma factor [Botrimarina mediterranea]|uniref:ECF-type sigma factor n=1 Tax=Botrimarina mediterranea TaxID=2528022 RepID=UPI00119F9C86